MKFFTTEKLGNTRHLTPDGFLVLQNVPIARTGVLIYGPNETPIETGEQGYAKILRDEDEVFRPESVASFCGKAVVVTHPEEDVTPENWNDLAVGTVHDPRRGDNPMQDFLIADLFITNKDAIQLIQNNDYEEVSCGYDADYEETGPGEGRQTNIIGNHVALVEKGRCGPRCAIQDHNVPIPRKEANMKRSKMLDALLKQFGSAFAAKDQAAMDEAAEAISEAKSEKAKDDEPTETLKENSDVHLHIHNESDPKLQGVGDEEPIVPGKNTKVFDDETEARFTSLEEGHAAILEQLAAISAKIGMDEGEEGMADAEVEKELKEEAPAGAKDMAGKAKDSAYLMDSFRDTASLAEIIVPGIRLPTVDKAAKPKDTFRKICNLRRQALDLAYVQPETRSMIEELISGKTLDTSAMTCDAVRTTFRSVAAMRKAANNGTRDYRPAAVEVKSRVTSLSDLNKANQKHYADNH